jgi:hypothetical protein
MPHDVDTHLITYIEASVRTTTRSREILILIIIVSVLVFGAFWNSRQGSWINERLRILSAAKEYKDREKTLAGLQRGTPEYIEAKIDLNKPRFADAAHFLALRPGSLPDAAAVEKMKNKLEEIETEHVLYLKLPFFGLFMDVNDLGLFGGFTFIVLLLWFRSSLWHEAQNLKISFREAESYDDLQFCYEALSMQQVLAAPRLPGDPSGPRGWRWIIYGLLALPMVVQGIVFLHDGFSFQYGWSVSPRNTIIGTTISTLFLGAILWLTAMCVGLLRQIAKQWNVAAERVDKLLDAKARSKGASGASTG